MTSRTFSLTWLHRSIVFILICGLFFRFYNLDRKVYWYDETMTSLRVAGYTQAEFVDRAFTGEVTSIGELRNTYQYPNETRDLKDSIDALSRHPEHSPLYYIIARWWLQLFGNSVTTIRSLSVVFGVAAIPLMYWLCCELFSQPLISWLGVAIFSISPFHVLYAQEAREYSLWTVTILLSSAVLLRTLRFSKSRISLSLWSGYGVTVALGLYAHPFSAFVLISHGLYVVISQGWKRLQNIIAYGGASLFGVLLFSPWLYIVLQNMSYFVQNTKSTMNPRENLHLIWGLNLRRIFVDVNQGMSPIDPTLYLVLFLVLYAILFLLRSTPSQTSLFVILLMGVTGMALLVPDILLGGRRSNNLRYVVPCVIGIQLAVTYLLGVKLLTLRLGFRSYRRWQYALLGLLFSGLISCIASSQAAVWWHKSYAKSRYNPAIASIISEFDRPLLISDEKPGRILSLSHLLYSDVKLQLIDNADDPDIPSNYQPIFLYRPSDRLQTSIQQQYNATIERAYKGWLWKLNEKG
ncbi:MAG: glycosyltransferase family 39 protein [Cyanobacteria bacterium SID2]|nr:glycosyltransferase family 39 protein [Cyanobacteria bacterium SID2]MBP0003024.1 glycosyltransferase family 39 protein [Cyanobacteria bacterium SBC]